MSVRIFFLPIIAPLQTRSMTRACVWRLLRWRLLGDGLITSCKK
jgi:hypothetical protein